MNDMIESTDDNYEGFCLTEDSGNQKLTIVFVTQEKVLHTARQLSFFKRISEVDEDGVESGFSFTHDDSKIELSGNLANALNLLTERAILNDTDSKALRERIVQPSLDSDDKKNVSAFDFWKQPQQQSPRTGCSPTAATSATTIVHTNGSGGTVS